MALILYGAPLCGEICEQSAERSRVLQARGVMPTLAVFRVGSDPAAGEYEQSLCRRGESCGVAVRRTEIAETESAEAVCAAFAALCADETVHGILLSLPLPVRHSGLTGRLCAMLPPEKDVDGVNPESLGRLWAGAPCFGACTAEACVRLVKAYGMELRGKNAVVIGRSVVVGKPLAAMLLRENATVTVCHRSTADTAAICRGAELIFCAAGSAGLVTAEYVREDSVVVDVGTNWDEVRQRLVGDADTEAVSKVAAAVSPVPGGVGVVTAAVLMEHVISAAENQA